MIGSFSLALLLAGALHLPQDQAAGSGTPPRPVWTLPIVVARYFPVQGDRVDVSVTGDWGESLEATRRKVDRIQAETLEALREGSRFRPWQNSQARPSLGYEVLREYEFLEPLPVREAPPGQAPMTDYAAIMERIDAQTWVEEQGVREIWIWAYHGGKVGLWESNMASPTGDVSNSSRDPDDLPVFSHTYTVYHYNYQRSSHEAVENHTHQIEHLLNHVDGRDRTPPERWNELLFWGKFVGSDASHRIVTDPARCGWTHYPPNAERDYDWANPRFVETDIEDWRPDGLGRTRRINCDRWDGDDLKWKVFWMQSLPGLDNGLSLDGRPLDNWWLFVADWDRARKEQRTLIRPEPSTPDR